MYKRQGVSAVKKLLGFEIREAPGEHARGKFRVLLSEEAPVVCERNVPVQLREEGNRAEALFCGYPQRTETMTEHGWRIAEIEAVSGTVLLDMEKRSRVFQDRRQTYLGIAGAVTAETGHSACILAGDDRETGGTLIQYGETDWKLSVLKHQILLHILLESCLLQSEFFLSSLQLSFQLTFPLYNNALSQVCHNRVFYTRYYRFTCM